MYIGSTLDNNCDWEKRTWNIVNALTFMLYSHRQHYQSVEIVHTLTLYYINRYHYQCVEIVYDDDDLELV